MNAKIVTASWVTDDGSYGYGRVILYDGDQLTNDQLETLIDLNDDCKMPFIQGLLNPQELTL